MLSGTGAAGSCIKPQGPKYVSAGVFSCPTCDVIVIKAGFFAILSLMGESCSPCSILPVSHPPLSPLQSIGGNWSPPCIQGLSAGGGGGSRDGVIEREIYYWWCLLMIVESCSGPHERALLDNVCGCNFLRRRRWRVQNKNISKGRNHTKSRL